MNDVTTITARATIQELLIALADIDLKIYQANGQNDRLVDVWPAFPLGRDWHNADHGYRNKLLVKALNRRKTEWIYQAYPPSWPIPDGFKPAWKVSIVERGPVIDITVSALESGYETAPIRLQMFVSMLEMWAIEKNKVYGPAEEGKEIELPTYEAEEDNDPNLSSDDDLSLAELIEMRYPDIEREYEKNRGRGNRANIDGVVAYEFIEDGYSPTAVYDEIIKRWSEGREVSNAQIEDKRRAMQRAVKYRQRK